MIRTPYRFLGQDQENDNGNILKIYCRLKPLEGNESCYIVQSPTKLYTIPPPTSYNNKHLEFCFSEIFADNASQKEVFDSVAFPLIQKVLQGQSCLLFSYGNTGSGKTYTMKGTLKEGGIMPRCLDVIFNSISQKLSKKHIFKSDRFNGFEIQSEKDATSDSHRALLKQIGNTKANKAKLTKKHNSDPDLAGRFIDPTQILMINDKNSYAVFITFIEIYNNSAYDLLDETLGDLHKQPSSKPIREDSKKNMFVYGVNEVEVTSTEEAYEVFYKGLKKRRVAQTLLNAQSSRSHSVFNIRVVQANLTEFGKVYGGKHGSNIPISIGQLSLVDLAGSERTSRTQNTGKNLMEAGNINNSLMTLRQCFDAIKENQRGGSRIVPYRDSKLTTLFKNYFEGDGFISMIVCINQHKDDYDETLHVLKFAESTQELHIAVSLLKQFEIEEEQRKQRMQRRIQALDDKISSLLNAHRDGIKSSSLEFQRNIYSCPVDNGIARDDAQSYLNFQHISNGVEYINRELNNSIFTPEYCQGIFSNLLKKIREGAINGYENEDLKILLRKEKEQRVACESENNLLKRKLEDTVTNNKRLKKELMEKEKTVLKAKAEKDREKEKLQLKKNVFREKYNFEVEKLKRQRTELEMEVQSKGEKLARVQRVLSDEIISTSSTPSVASCRAKFEQFATPSTVGSTPKVPHSARPATRRANIAVSNRRHRRSRSTGDVWVEHTAAMPVPLNTVLQPSLPKRRSITKLTDAKQVTQGASKYCLVTQTQDSDGDLETRVYKADVIPTSGGGAQVLFNDVEVLKQVSPDASPKRPKEDIIDPQASCSYAIEGHRLRTRHMK